MKREHNKYQETWLGKKYNKLNKHQQEIVYVVYMIFDLIGLLLGYLLSLAFVYENIISNKMEIAVVVILCGVSIWLSVHGKRKYMPITFIGAHYVLNMIKAIFTVMIIHALLV